MYKQFKNIKGVPIGGIAPNQTGTLTVSNDGFLMTKELREAQKKGYLIEVKTQVFETKKKEIK
ncbi:hypothetical protein [Neisseria sp. Ec49-e6-T10]|uniref:hypothetical protein n=1 Tax=Neisseria sp. Ec49-e6-T10 TaxID=3140744 RepID=UPI003EBA3C38